MRFEKLQTKKSIATIELPGLFETFDSFDKSRSDFETALIRLKFRTGVKNLRNLNNRSDELVLNFRGCIAGLVGGETNVDSRADEILAMINLENHKRTSFIRELLPECRDSCSAPEQTEDDLNELSTDIFTELVDNGKNIDKVSFNIANIFEGYLSNDVRHFNNHLGDEIQDVSFNNLRTSVRALGFYGLWATGIATTAISLVQLIK